MAQYKVLIVYIISNGLSKNHLRMNWKMRTGAIGRARHLRTSLRRIPHEGTSIQSLPASLFAQASGQSGHSIVRGVTYESGTDPDYYVANQSDE